MSWVFRVQWRRLTECQLWGPRAHVISEARAPNSDYPLQHPKPKNPTLAPKPADQSTLFHHWQQCRLGPHEVWPLFLPWPGNYCFLTVVRMKGQPNAMPV